MFREVVTRHQDIVSVPSAVKYHTASKPKVAKETEIMAPFDDVSGFIAALIEYALVNADVKVSCVKLLKRSNNNFIIRQ